MMVFAAIEVTIQFDNPQTIIDSVDAPYEEWLSGHAFELYEGFVGG